jgi:hypothetical protein
VGPENDFERFLLTGTKPLEQLGVRVGQCGMATCRGTP